jgi:hypothetical protein
MIRLWLGPAFITLVYAVAACAVARSPASVTADAPVGEYFTPEGVDALCKGPRVGVDEGRPFRGVTPADNGGGRCCSLEESAFFCSISDGMQHTPLLVRHARFFAVSGGAPALDLVDAIEENLGMTQPSKLLVELVVRLEPDGFTLTAEPPAFCRPVDPEVRDLCRAEGHYRWSHGVPVRVSGRGSDR